ncbi:unnamed protein product [Lymnaea stagnalis]|uniref:Profilin n=1 Tax=Lymnaea stagnalis TaxID=6523 RepID=A0AAV2H053_LYMST
MSMTGKVNHAFVASIEGKILAKTSGLMIPADDVTTLICSLTSNYSGSVKLSLMTFTYTCFKDDLNSALIGKAENSIFVARLGSQNVVVGFTDPCTPGSCIREIQELSTALSQRGL